MNSASDPIVRKSVKRLMAGSIIFTIVLCLWPVMMLIFPPIENTELYVTWISGHLNAYRFQFLFAFLIAPAFLFMAVTQYQMLGEPFSGTGMLGFLFLSAYLVSVSISYGSQLVILPRLIHDGDAGEIPFWLFSSQGSIAYFLNQLGYFFWSCGIIPLFISQLRRKGIPGKISLIYFCSAVLSIIAFAGLLFDSATLNSLTLPAGLLLLPTGVMSVLWAVRMRKQAA